MPFSLLSKIGLLPLIRTHFDEELYSHHGAATMTARCRHFTAGSDCWLELFFGRRRYCPILVEVQGQALFLPSCGINRRVHHFSTAKFSPTRWKNIFFTAYRRKSAKTKKSPHHAPFGGRRHSVIDETNSRHHRTYTSWKPRETTILFPEKRCDNVILRAKNLWASSHLQKGR